jgi:hypothetical protein
MEKKSLQQAELGADAAPSLIYHESWLPWQRAEIVQRAPEHQHRRSYAEDVEALASEKVPQGKSLLVGTLSARRVRSEQRIRAESRETLALIAVAISAFLVIAAWLLS